MKRRKFGSLTFWNTTLMFIVVFAVFILPVMPPVFLKSLFGVVFTIIYISAILSLEKRSNYTLVLFFSTVFLEWVTGIFNLPIIQGISRGLRVVFFLVIVSSLIRQIAKAKNVSLRVILNSLVAYLLLGLVFSVFVAFIMKQDPAAFSSREKYENQTEESLIRSIPIYFSFVTLATLGYGDIIPLKPYTRSLAILIAITGQFYIAIIVAMLVGKYSSYHNST